MVDCRDRGLLNRLRAGVVGVSTALAVSVASVNAAEVTIKRDAYGTPHIHAEDRYGLFLGYGYAMAQDRLYQLEMTRRSTQGTVSEVLGEDYVDFDIGIRRHYSPSSIRTQLEALPREKHDILQGYADGINRWLEAIEGVPESLMPIQFLTAEFEPAPWDAFDVAMIFIGTMVNRFGDYNSELENQQLLAALVEEHGEASGRALFDELLAFYDPSAPTTIPIGDWDPRNRDDAFDLGDATQLPLNPNLPLTLAEGMENPPLLAARGGSLQRAGVEELPFSNLLILGPERSVDAKAILINGPQFGFYQPAYTYSVGLHGAGYSAVGNSPFGYPMVMFGHNESITWGSTWGAADNVDVFRLELDPENPERYRFNDTYRELEVRTEIIDVKGEESREITVYRSHHGPVIDYRPEQGIAYAKARGWEGHEVDTLMAWHDIATASTHEEWLARVERSAINANWYYADRDGNIAYVMGGRYPKRAAGHDGRLPVPGSGEYDWRGFMPFDTNPQVLNPSTGYIANWNQRAAEGMPNPDMWWYAWHEADRVQTLFDAVEARQHFTADEAWELMMEASFIDPSPRFFIPRLLDAMQGIEDGHLRDAADLLAAWSHREIDRNGDGDYDDAAIPLYRTWLTQLIGTVFNDLLPAAHAPWFLTTGHLEPGGSTPGSTNISVAAKVLHKALQRGSDLAELDLFNGRDPDALMREALAAAVDEPTASQGDDMSAWRTAVTHTSFSHFNFLKIPQADEQEVMHVHHAMNRGTENNMTVFSANGVAGYEVVAPGQSGFISPDGIPSPHYRDQLELFEALGHKRIWIQPEDIEANTASVETLRY